ncbi:unnamed protein product [Adineta ricciae]|uniref:Uncharacterized protein n=1 Tax=Adineta ricciae TaxID=249248 RepID=A0A815RHF5_ADIRI|nr:unnamed protein product [Adineta ricciae]CAF1573652.1 unnamed protein product [Adineta ricciae]
MIAHRERSSYSANGKIRFIFPEPQLLEYLRHTIIQYYSSLAENARRLNCIADADRFNHTAKQHYMELVKEFGTRIDTQIAIDAQDLPNDHLENEDEDPILFDILFPPINSSAQAPA